MRARTASAVIGLCAAGAAGAAACAPSGPPRDVARALILEDLVEPVCFVSYGFSRLSEAHPRYEPNANELAAFAVTERLGLTRPRADGGAWPELTEEGARYYAESAPLTGGMAGLCYAEGYDIRIAGARMTRASNREHDVVFTAQAREPADWAMDEELQGLAVDTERNRASIAAISAPQTFHAEIGVSGASGAWWNYRTMGPGHVRLAQ